MIEITTIIAFASLFISFITSSVAIYVNSRNIRKQNEEPLEVLKNTIQEHKEQDNERWNDIHRWRDRIDKGFTEDNNLRWERSESRWSEYYRNQEDREICMQSMVLALFALLDHAITGDGIEILKGARNELQKYIAKR